MKTGKEITLENELKIIREEKLYRNTDLHLEDDKGYYIKIDILIPEHVNIFGVDLELNMNDIFKIIHGNWASDKRRKEFVEKHKEQFEKQLNIEGIKKGIEAKKQKINDRNKKIQKLYDELYEVYSSLGYKADITKLNELNDLLYCEAETFLNDIENKIFKKKTAKAIRCYKKLMEIRGKSNEVIECD